MKKIERKRLPTGWSRSDPEWVNLKCLWVGLENTGTAWQAIYAALHVASRLGSKLVGIAPLDRQSREEAESAIQQFKTGARAAGVTVQTMLLPSLSGRIIQGMDTLPDAIFIGRPQTTGRRQLEELIQNLSCPVWVVPAQSSIRKILLVENQDPDHNSALSLALVLARRWNLSLHLLQDDNGAASLSNPGVTGKGTLFYQYRKKLDLEAFLEQIHATQADLACVDRNSPYFSTIDLCLQTDRPVAVCP